MSSFPMVVVVVFGCICVWWCLRSKPYTSKIFYLMGLLPDTQNCGLRRYRKCRERFPHHRLQRKPLVSDPGSAVMHVGIANPWWQENIPDILGAFATRSFAYLVRGMPMLLCLIFFHIPIKVLYNLNAFSVTVYKRYYLYWISFFKPTEGLVIWSYFESSFGFIGLIINYMYLYQITTNPLFLHTADRIWDTFDIPIHRGFLFKRRFFKVNNVTPPFSNTLKGVSVNFSRMNM